MQLKAELAGDESKERRDEDGGPDAVHQAEQPQSRGEGNCVRHQHQDVVARALSQQPGGFHAPLELGVGLRDR